MKIKSWVIAAYAFQRRLCNMPCTIEQFKDVKSVGQAQAYYACQYFESIASTNLIRNILSVAKAATDLYFAQKNYEIQKGNLERLNKITEQQLAQSADLHGQWAYGKACERAQLDAACNTNIPEPNYQAIYSRVASVIAAQFGNARRKIKKTYSVYCQAASCTAMRQLDIEEARTIAGAVEAAYRKSEANWKIETAAARVHLLNVLQHMRGLLANTSGLLNGASASAQAAAAINPYRSFQNAANNIFGMATATTYQGAMAAQGAGSINGMNAFNSNNLNLDQSTATSNTSFVMTNDYNNDNELRSLSNRYPNQNGSTVNVGGGSSDPFAFDYENESDRGNNFMNGPN
jgi:hypothetical protein